MSKPTFALDLDGIVCDWDRGVRLCLKRHLGVEIKEKVSPFWSYVDSQLTPEQTKWLWTEGILKGMYTLGGLYPDTAEAVARLRRETRFTILTMRPLVVERLTLKYLWHKLGIPPEEVFFILPDGDKADFVADIYLEDSPVQLANLTHVNGATVLGWKRRWNEDLRAWRGIRWVDSWKGVFENI